MTSSAGARHSAVTWLRAFIAWTRSDHCARRSAAAQQDLWVQPGPT